MSLAFPSHASYERAKFLQFFSQKYMCDKLLKLFKLKTNCNSLPLHLCCRFARIRCLLCKLHFFFFLIFRRPPFSSTFLCYSWLVIYIVLSNLEVFEIVFSLLIFCQLCVWMCVSTCLHAYIYLHIFINNIYLPFNLSTHIL